MSATMTRCGRKPTSTEKINKRLLVWVAPSHYDALLQECQAAGYASLGAYVREAKQFTDDSLMALSPQDVPTMTEIAPIVGESDTHRLDELKSKRVQEVAFRLAKHTLEKYFRDGEHVPLSWFFPQLLDITRRWLHECLIYKDGTFPQMLLLSGLRNEAIQRIYASIVASTKGEKTLKPMLLLPLLTIGDLPPPSRLFSGIVC
jgi:hypothetical protein